MYLTEVKPIYLQAVKTLERGGKFFCLKTKKIKIDPDPNLFIFLILFEIQKVPF